MFTPVRAVFPKVHSVVDPVAGVCFLNRAGFPFPMVPYHLQGFVSEAQVGWRNLQWAGPQGPLLPVAGAALPACSDPAASSRRPAGATVTKQPSCQGIGCREQIVFIRFFTLIEILSTSVYNVLFSDLLGLSKQIGDQIRASATLVIAWMTQGRGRNSWARLASVSKLLTS